jgi:hypothetical protein
MAQRNESATGTQHPLAVTRTELVWEGKYDSAGNKGDTFHNEWQTHRTRQEPKLDLATTHAYTEPGQYTVVVKAIDILGNDTMKTVKVKVK